MDNLVAEKLVAVLSEIRDELRRMNGEKVELPRTIPVTWGTPPTVPCNVDPRDAIIYDPVFQDYYVSVQIQDGYEQCGKYKDRNEAIASYVQGYKVLNGTKLKPEDVPIYEIVPNQKQTYSYRKLPNDREIAMDEMRQDFA